jgi:hypothetical protein
MSIRTSPVSKPQAIICPYCGETQAASDRCRACGGLFEPLSRQATHNEMGPWFIRSPARPFQPGCSYETLIKLLERGQVNRHTLLRGPSTKQFWTIAKRVPGVAHLLGFCHQCDAEVNPGDHGCSHCGVPFGAYLDRNHLGLPEIRPLPWEIDGETADAAGGREQRNGGALRSERGAPAPQRGLSSFATDQELLGTAPHYSQGVAGPELQAPLAPAAALSPGFESRLSGVGRDRAVDSPTLRAMQTSLAQQRRTSRLLMAIIAALAIALVIVLLQTGGSDAGSSGAGASRVTDKVASPAAPSKSTSPAKSGAEPPRPLESATTPSSQPQPQPQDAAQSLPVPSSVPPSPSEEPPAPPLPPGASPPLHP